MLPWTVRAGTGALCSQRDPPTRATPESVGPRAPLDPPLILSSPPACCRHQAFLPGGDDLRCYMGQAPTRALGRGERGADSLPGKVPLRGKFSSEEREAGLHLSSPTRTQTPEESLWKERELAASTLFLEAALLFAWGTSLCVSQSSPENRTVYKILS